MKSRAVIFALWSTVIVFGCAKKDQPEKEVTPTFVVEVGAPQLKTIRETMTLDGTFLISQGNLARLSAAVAGRLTDVLVKEGDHVSAGQVLARVDRRVLDSQSKSAAAAAAAAKSQTRQASAALRALASEHASSVKTARLSLEAAEVERSSNVDQARLDLQRLKAGARPEELALAGQSLNQARVNAQLARDTANRDRTLFKQGFVSGQQAQASDAAFKVAQSAVTQAETQLALLKAGPRKEELRAAELRLSAAVEIGDKKVQLASAALDQALKGGLTVDAKAEELNAARFGADQKNADSVAAAQLATNGELRAPFAGIVSRRLLNSGDSVDTTTVVMELVRGGSQTDFVAQTTARQAAKLSTGMVAIESEGPAGKVVAIGIADPQSGLVSVRVSFPGANVRSSGEASRVSVVLHQQEGALAVPETTIVTRNEKQVVFLADGEKAKLVEIKVGATDHGWTSVVSGLKATDKLILSGQHELADGVKIELAKKTGEAP